MEVAGGDVDNDDVDHFDDDGDCVDYEDYNVYSTIYKWWDYVRSNMTKPDTNNYLKSMTRYHCTCKQRTKRANKLKPTFQQG